MKYFKEHVCQVETEDFILGRWLKSLVTEHLHAVQQGNDLLAEKRELAGILEPLKSDTAWPKQELALSVQPDESFWVLIAYRKIL